MKSDGFPDGKNIFRRGTMELMRRSVKLMYDDGITGSPLWFEIFTYASTALIHLHRRLTAEGWHLLRSPSEQMNVGRLIHLLTASMSLLRQCRPKNDPKVRQAQEAMDNQLSAFKVVFAVSLTLAEREEKIGEILRDEPDPFEERHWRPS